MKYRIELGAFATVYKTVTVEADTFDDAIDAALSEEGGDVEWKYDGVVEGSVVVNNFQQVNN